jgi:hypothetical protein
MDGERGRVNDAAVPGRRPAVSHEEDTMTWMLLIVEPGGQRRATSQAEGEARYRAMSEYGESLRARGLLIDTQSLRTDGARVRVHDGRRSVTDGPFAEAKEMIGGYFLLDTADRATAIEAAAECPAAAWAIVEVRELGPCFT